MVLMQTSNPCLTSSLPCLGVKWTPFLSFFSCSSVVRPFQNALLHYVCIHNYEGRGIMIWWCGGNEPHWMAVIPGESIGLTASCQRSFLGGNSRLWMPSTSLLIARFVNCWNDQLKKCFQTQCITICVLQLPKICNWYPLGILLFP